MNLSDRFRDADTDEGVSPVIGVILMVALTVILSATVGTYVLGFSDFLDKPVQAGVDVDSDYNSNIGAYEVTFTLTSLDSAETVFIKKGTAETAPMDDVGESVTVTANQGEQLTVVAARGDQEQVQRIIRVGE